MYGSNDCTFPGLGRAVERARGLLEKLGKSGPGNCLFAAGVLAACLRADGYKALVQGGAAFWRRLDPSDPAAAAEPGSVMFGYCWEPVSAVAGALLDANQLPEFHAWVGLVPDPARPEFGDGAVVDIAAASVPDHAAALCPGIAWTAPRPPAVFGFLPAGARTDYWQYEAHPVATIFCDLMFWRAAAAKRLLGQIDAGEYELLAGDALGARVFGALPSGALPTSRLVLSVARDVCRKLGWKWESETAGVV